jgi:hypothetical protein
MKYLAERNTVTAKLDKNRRKKSTGILFSGVLEIEEEVRHVCGPGVGSEFDVLNDRRTNDI